MNAQPAGVKGFDMAVSRALSGGIVTAGAFTLPCYCNSTEPRWYVAAVRSCREIEARDELDAAGLATFLPLVLVEVSHARRREMVQRPAFRGYLLVRLDLAVPGWQRIREIGRRPWRPGPVLRLMGASPDRPTPLPAGTIQRLIAAGFDRPITEDIAPMLIAAGAPVSIAAGPFTDHRGVCQWDDGKRVRVLLSIMGREAPVDLDRREVRPA